MRDEQSPPPRRTRWVPDDDEQGSGVWMLWLMGVGTIVAAVLCEIFNWAPRP